MTVIVKSGKVRVLQYNGSSRIHGIFHKGKIYTPKNVWATKKYSSTKVRLKGKKRLFVRPKK